MCTYVFPGQGSQIKGMGKNLFTEFPDLVQKAEDILGYSVIKLCLENPNGELNKTQYTQSALYLVNVLSYLKKIQECPQKPDYLAGHSLGEYNALFAAGVFDFETGLRLVKKRGELMSQFTDGGMAAVVGLRDEDVRTILRKEGLIDITIANYNSYTQMVIAGPKNSITIAQPIFEEAGATLFLPLNVSGAFHSFFIERAQKPFAEFLKNFIFQPPIIPVISNFNARPYQTHEIQPHLVNQMTQPVQWTRTIKYLLKQGEIDFIELGPGTVLTGLIRRIKNYQ